MGGSTETPGFTKLLPGSPQVLMRMASRFMALFSSSLRSKLVLMVRVRFVALLSSVGVHAKQELVRFRQVLVRGST